MNEKPNILQQAVNDAGGAQAVATACGGITYQAVNKWIRKGMPRTEYTGETQYSLTISRMTGGKYSIGELLPSRKPRS